MEKREKSVRKHKGLGWKIFLTLVLICGIFALVKFVPFGSHDLSPAPDVAIKDEALSLRRRTSVRWMHSRVRASSRGRSS